VKRYLAPILCAALAGCVPAITPLDPGPNGLEAIRFKRTLQVQHFLANIYTFQAGSVFVADRAWEGGTLYCGTALMVDHIEALCLALKDDTTLVVKADKPLAVERPIPPGSIERFKLK
jgi:hypothetical protein